MLYAALLNLIYLANPHGSIVDTITLFHFQGLSNVEYRATVLEALWIIATCSLAMGFWGYFLFLLFQRVSTIHFVTATTTTGPSGGNMLPPVRGSWKRTPNPV